MTPDQRPRTVAFYLPQYHQIPENDEWWGPGFTDWTNVRKAKPLFEGHHQPRRPTDLGYYDLSSDDVLAKQTELARVNGIDAFCFYFYWFDGQRLLEKPLDAYRDSGNDFPYCISWANEAWTRRWDGKHKDVLMPQTYAKGFADEIFADFLEYFRAPHYLTVDGRPVLVVHRVTEIPNAGAVAARWRSLARSHGLPGLHLVAAETTRDLDPREFGFDASVEFPPVGWNTLRTALPHRPPGLMPGFRGRLLSYDRLARRFCDRPSPDFIRYRGVAPGWDNTARRGRAATVYVGASPRAYADWLRHAREDEGRQRRGHGLVFINAWNEWAEGAYLEPDLSNGDAYLRATSPRADPATLPAGRGPHSTAHGRPPISNLSRLVLSSMVAAGRSVRRALTSVLRRRRTQ